MLRLKLLIFLNENNLIYLSDKYFLEKYYKYIYNRKLNIDDPMMFSEKLQWLKLYDRNPEYCKLVDKYSVKEYVENKIGKEYIIPTYGVYNSFNEIDFDTLPNQFVIKTTHCSGDTIICKDKNSFNFNVARTIINKSLHRNYYKHKREWPYKNVIPRIIIEKYMENKEQKELVNYKFFCFNGKPDFLYIIEGKDENKHITSVDLDFNILQLNRNDYKDTNIVPHKPINFNEMIDIASKLSEGTKFVRVDLYEIDGRIYFSELTFFPVGGFIPFNSEEYDLYLGNKLKLQ